jgi:uncharacterized protein
MLLRFSVQNWMSFRDEVTLSMIATRERQQPRHLSSVKPCDVNVLPIAVIYGANASGKSNLVKALRFAQRFVVDPPKPEAAIPVLPFRLDKASSEHPTRFCFELDVEQMVYEYNFEITSERVTREALKRITKTVDEPLFEREEGSLKTLSPMLSKREELQFAFKGTEDNELYLTNSVSQKQKQFKPIFDWFRERLVLIGPDTRYAGIPDIAGGRHPSFDLNMLNNRLRALDSGIQSLRWDHVSPETLYNKEILEILEIVGADLKEGETVPTPWQDDGSFLTKRNGTVVASRISPVHSGESGQEIPFTFAEESDGTKRLFDLVPAFLHLEEAKQPFVFVIDELDRSLHSLLTRSLLERYLRRTEQMQSQLIFTTHDLQLMDQDIFRRDEMWVTERDQAGASKLIAFSDYKDVRKDKDIRKSYLQGRMGGIPKIMTPPRECDPGGDE